MENEHQNKKKLSFYGGKLGGYIPFISLVIIILSLTAAGKGNLKVFWTAGFFSLCISFLFVKDKKYFNNVVIEGLLDPMFSSFMIIFFLAGIMSQILRQSGLINGLLLVCTSLNVSSGLLPLITFLSCVMISTACGTTGGTVSAVTPIMFPLSVSLGCNPALILGAIISGSIFGDNLAPISDTTIASSGNMRANVLKVVRSRLKYSAIAGVIASILYVIVGFSTTNPVAVGDTIDPSYAKTLILLVVPLIMAFLMLKGFQLVPVLLVCDMVALGLVLILKLVPFAAVFDVEGPIISGIDSMMSVVVFTAFVFILLKFTRSSGVFEELIFNLTNKCKTAFQAELVTAVLVTFGVLITGGTTVAIVIVGPVGYALYKSFNIDRRRGANILDGVACSIGGILPWNNSLMVMYGLAQATGYLPEDFAIVNLIPYSFHAIALLILYFICIFTGLWRTEEIYSDTIETASN